MTQMCTAHLVWWKLNETISYGDRSTELSHSRLERPNCSPDIHFKRICLDYARQKSRVHECWCGTYQRLDKCVLLGHPFHTKRNGIPILGDGAAINVHTQFAAAVETKSGAVTEDNSKSTTQHQEVLQSARAKPNYVWWCHRVG